MNHTMYASHNPCNILLTERKTQIAANVTQSDKKGLNSLSNFLTLRVHNFHTDGSDVWGLHTFLQLGLDCYNLHRNGDTDY